MAWFHLLVAAAFEVAFAMGMKFSNGFGRLWPSLLTVVAAIGGIYFLTLALRELPVSVAYPIWTAIGSLGTVFLGVLLLGESLTAVKLVSVRVDRRRGGRAQVSDAAFGLQSAAFPFLRAAMLTTLAVSNYRTLRDLVMPLRRLNQITGANGAG